MSLGRAVGAVGGGFLFSLGGGTLLFRVGAIIMCCVSILFAGVVFTDRGFIEKEKEVNQEDAQKLELELIDVFSADEEDEDLF